MTTETQKQRSKIISTVLAFWPQANETEEELQETIGMYQLALDGIAPKFFEAAAKAFIQGRVATHNPSFRPKPSEIAAYARSAQDRDTDARNRKDAQRLQIESRGRDEPTPEEKMAVAQKLKKFHADMAGKSSEWLGTMPPGK